MTFAHCYDAAYPPPVPYPNCAAVLGYIGGTDETNIWSLDNWLVAKDLLQFPCWPTNMTQGAVPEAHHMAEAAITRGWTPHGHGAEKRCIVVDTEALVDRAWIKACEAELDALGFVLVNYGSLDYVTANGANVIWIAAYGSPVVLTGRDEAWQYAANIRFRGTQVDLSLVSPELLQRAGRGPRKGPQ